MTNRTVDIAIYIALGEEFSYFSDVWPRPSKTEEDAEFSITYHYYRISDHSGEKDWTVVTVSGGAMGQERSAAIATRIITKFSPKIFCILGISGSLDPDFLLGDVIVPTTVQNYLADSAAVPSDDPDGWSFDLSGENYRSDSRLLNRLQSLQHTYGHVWENWKQNTLDVTNQDYPHLTPSAIESGIMHTDTRLHTEQIVLASGPTVGKADAFCKWIRNHNRKARAIDMESAGSMGLSDLLSNSNSRFLAIRGISDFADDRKNKIEQAYRNHFRRMAMENCSTLLLALIQGGLFLEQALTSPDAKERPPEPQQNFANFLEHTEVDFQHRHKLSVTLNDLFVYPDLLVVSQKASDSEFKTVNSSVLCDLQTAPELVLVFGHELSGKTSLLKVLCRSYISNGSIPILVNGADVRNADIERLLKRMLTAQYQNIPSQTIQTLRKRIIVLIDDAHKIRLNEKTQERIVRWVRDNCSRLIIFTDIASRANDYRSGPLGEAVCYEILPLGHHRRSEIITKWCNLGQEESISDAELLFHVDELTKHVNSIIANNILPTRPFYICTILQTVESTFASDYSLTSYGHCYQSLIMQAFSRGGISPSEFDTHVNFLTELAYFIHKEKEDRISVEQFNRFKYEYEQKYIKITQRDIVERLVRVGILKISEERIGFRHRFIQHFYCARYLSEYLDEPGIQKEVEDICANLYLETNAKIVIFLTHHTKRQKVIDEIVLNAMVRLSDLEEALLDSAETLHFKEYADLIPKLVMEQTRVEEMRREQLMHRDEIERLGEKNRKNDTERDSDRTRKNNESEMVSDTAFAEVHSSLRSIEIIGQILRNRYGSFDRGQLRMLAEEAIKVGLRVLRHHQDGIAKNEKAVIDFIGRIMEENSDSEPEEIGEIARRIYLHVCYWTAYAFIEKIAESIGYERLSEIYEDIKQDHLDSPAVRLIHLSIKLNAEKVLPKALIEDLYRDLQGDSVAQRLMRQIILRYVYLNAVKIRDKQWLSAKVDIPMVSQSLVEYQKKVEN